ncbi:TerD family protein [Chitinimonas lacunae]|uniref:TerD family protein n=1 Tax=Chitinimonas lacunae TaxID=1963018 RepID=A0ABV8MKW3_9NEIS
MNTLFLRRQGKLYLKAGNGSASRQQVATLQREIELYGYVFSDALFAQLQTHTPESLSWFLRNLREDLQTMTGGHRQYGPLFPGFPEQVMVADEVELYLSAIEHYRTLKRQPASPRQHPPLLHGRAPKEVDLGTLEEFEAIFTRLAGGRASLSKQDRDDLVWFIRHYRDDIFRLLPTSFSFRENLALSSSALLTHLPGDKTLDFLFRHHKTATDVLRLVVALSGGDISLAEPTRFRPMKRGLRRTVLQLLENCADPTEDMRRQREAWKRLGEILHPGDYAERFPKTYAAFRHIRDDLPSTSFNTLVERQLAAADFAGATATLSQRPGEMGRRLDLLLRHSDQPETVLTRFAEIAPAISTLVLLQMHAHFHHRQQPVALRTFFPKGDMANAFAIPDRRRGISPDLAARTVALIELVLQERFSRLTPLGRCYLDPALSGFMAPLAQRSASKALRTLVRGSRLPFEHERYIRLFLWWKNGKERTDIDLSAVFYDEQFNYRDTVSYYNLRGYGGHHSGDIVDAPEGAAEFIDLDLDRLSQRSIRFVVVTLNSYTEQPYCELPECFAGWMARIDVASGEVFEPRTVENRIDLAADTRMCIPFIIDVSERQIIWTDIGLTGQVGWNNVHNNLSGISLMLRAMHKLPRPDLHTLFRLHAQARGQIVDSPTAADTVFSLQQGITPFHTDLIRAEYF